MVCAEQLERNRRDPENKYKLAQWDETAFGKRKYERGSRVRQRGVQWGLTVVEVDPLTNKTLSVDLQFLPYNRRDSNNITPLIVQRMEPGGTIVTDVEDEDIVDDRDYVESEYKRPGAGELEDEDFVER